MKKMFVLDYAPVFSWPEQKFAAARVPALNACFASLLFHVVCFCLFSMCSAYLTSRSDATEPLKAPEHFILVYHPQRRRVFKLARLRTAIAVPRRQSRPPERQFVCRRRLLSSRLPSFFLWMLRQACLLDFPCPNPSRQHGRGYPYRPDLNYRPFRQQEATVGPPGP
jgi:hypothetical protein